MLCSLWSLSRLYVQVKDDVDEYMKADCLVVSYSRLTVPLVL